MTNTLTDPKIWYLCVSRNPGVVNGVYLVELLVHRVLGHQGFQRTAIYTVTVLPGVLGYLTWNSDQLALSDILKIAGGT
jgi:hypothetical protein